MRVLIDDVETPLRVNSLNVSNAVGQRSTASVTLRDDAGANHYEDGQRIDIIDDDGTLAYSGVLDGDDEDKPLPGVSAPLLWHQVACKDWHYLADKRRAAKSYAAGQTCGQVIKDLVSTILANEGVTSTSNLYSGQQSSLDGPLDLTEWGGIAYKVSCGPAGGISRDTAQAWQGAAALKVQMDGSGTFQSISVNLPASMFAPGQQYTVSFYIKAQAGTPSLRYFFEGNDLIAGNHAIGSTASVASPTTTGWTRYSVTATMPATIVDQYIGLRLDTGGTAQAVTFWLDGLQLEKGASASAWVRGAGMETIAEGIVLPEVLFNYAKVSECLDAITQKAGAYWWQIDQYKRLWFQPYAAVPAPWALTADANGVVADARAGTLKVKRGKPLYRNRQYVIGATDVTSTQTETRKGDGTTTAWTFGYPFASVPTVKVNGVTKTVGIKGVDTGKDFYWNKGDATLTQDSGGTILTSSDTLQVTYVGQYPVVIVSEDTAQVLAQQALEGGGTTGYVEDVIGDSSLASRDAAFQEASALLAKYAQAATTLRFQTSRPGLAPGQMLTVTIPAHAFDQAQLLIESVTITDEDATTIWYDVTALLGPVNSNWVSFFGQLANNAQVSSDQLSVGQNSTLVVAQPFSESWGWSESMTPRVTACTFPGASVYPSTTLYPC